MGSRPWLGVVALAAGAAFMAQRACPRAAPGDGGPDAAAPGAPGVLVHCEGDAERGRETRLGTDARCGACGDTCAAGERCVGAVCLPIAELAMSMTHTCVLTRGRVRCWGGNEAGELGDGTRLLRDRPVTVAGIDDAVALAVRERETCVRRASGAVSCWGEAFGTGRPGVVRLVPTEIDALRGATEIALAEDVLCGLVPGRGVVCLPSSPLSRALSGVGPPPGEPVADAVHLAAAARELCAARRDGSVVCWDLRPYEDLPAAERRRPIAGVAGALGLTAGPLAVCALGAGNLATCWGVGIVTAPDTIRPASVGGAHDFSALGGVSDLAFLGWPDTADCATRLDGATVCWAPPSIDLTAAPGPLALTTRVLPLPPAVRVAATKGGAAHCVLARTGDVSCWGDPSVGRLGVGRPLEQPSPRPIEGVRDVRTLVASDSRVCAESGGGVLRCWGAGRPVRDVKVAGLDRLLSARCASIRGELVCFDDLLASPLPASGLRDVVQIVPAAQGSNLLSYFARHRDGSLSRLDYRRDGSTWSRVLSARVRGRSGVTALSTVGDATCLRAAGPSLACWSNLPAPVLDAEGRVVLTTMTVTPPAGFDEVHLTRLLDDGRHEGCGLTGGRVACWDLDGPPRFAPIEHVRRFDVSPNGLRCALASDGVLSCWRGWGQALTGHGTLAGARVPEPVPGLVDVIDFAFEQRSWNLPDAVFAWQRDGRLLAWGHNGVAGDDATVGQLGWIAPTLIETPTRVELPAD